MFPATALFYLAFSLIVFILVKDRAIKAAISLKSTIKNAFFQLKGTISSLHKYKGLLPFLISSFIYTDAMNTVILFLYLYAREQIKLPLISFFYLYALFAFTAIIGSLIFGKISDSIGPKRTLVIVVLIWTAVILLLIKASTITSFIIAGCIGGAVLGAVWAVTRPMLVKLSPRKKIAQLFGFQGLTEKFSGVIGPIIFGFVVVRFNYQSALFVLIGLFALALLFLYFVPDKR